MSATVIFKPGQHKPSRPAAFEGGNGRLSAPAPALASALSALGISVAVLDARGVIVAVNDPWRRYADENGLRWPRHGVGFNYLAALDRAAESDPGTANIAGGIRGVLQGSTASYRVEYSCDTPGGCHFLQQVTAFELDGARHVVVSHENITQQKLNEAELRAAKEAAESACREAETARAAAESRQRTAEAVADLLAIASSGRHIDDALDAMVERVRATSGGSAAAIYSVAEGWDHPVLVAGSEARPPRKGTIDKVLTPAVLAQALARPRGVVVTHTPLVDAAQASPGASHVPSSPAHSLIATPIQCADRLYGYLAVYHGDRHDLDEGDVELNYLFARQIGLAVDNAELRKRAEQTAIENERSRIARDLHDAVTQTLFSASVVAEALPWVWERDPAAGRAALAELRQWTRGALAEMRMLLMELRPAALIEKPLPDLIRQLGEAAATRLLIPVMTDAVAEVEPPADVKLALYRIAQEALSNVVKHAAASHVEVDYRARSQEVRLAIVDDGCGFEVDARAEGQMGLCIMQERARQMGAKLTVRSAPGRGTEVRVSYRPRRRSDLHV